MKCVPANAMTVFITKVFHPNTLRLQCSAISRTFGAGDSRARNMRFSTEPSIKESLFSAKELRKENIINTFEI